jgi:hypothetical protein
MENYCLKTNDHHEDMNGEVFRDWFVKIFRELNLTMGNVPYHTVRAELLHNRSWLRDDIIAWMQEKNLLHDKNIVKDELLHKRDRFILAPHANISML